MDCQRNYIDEKLVENLILCADAVCDVVRNTLCGCEACSIWQTWYYDVNGGNPAEEESKKWKCPMHEAMDKLRKQIEGEDD